MARIQVHRAEAFVIGDLIVQIDIDGKKAGSLIGAKPLELELPAGTYTMQARMFGNQKGNAVVLNVAPCLEALTVLVSGTRLGLLQHPLEGMLTVVMWASPWFPVWFLCIKMAVLAAWMGFIAYRWKRTRSHLLRLGISDGITSESRASSTRLSSLR